MKRIVSVLRRPSGKAGLFFNSKSSPKLSLSPPTFLSSCKLHVSAIKVLQRFS